MYHMVYLSIAQVHYCNFSSIRKNVSSYKLLINLKISLHLLLRKIAHLTKADKLLRTFLLHYKSCPK